MNTEDIIDMALAGKQNLRDRISYAIALEREACAALCFQMWSKWMDSRIGNEILDNSNCPDAEDCAFAIRERGAP